jgi:hypothetical protein
MRAVARPLRRSLRFGALIRNSTEPPRRFRKVSGNLVMFDDNASMLVHSQNEEFPYKTPFIHRIKSAFDEMLRKLATAGVSRSDGAACDPGGN